MNSGNTNNLDDSVVSLVRPELLKRVAYLAASPERTAIRLHANENPWSIESELESSGTNSVSVASNSDQHSVTDQRELNRYPSPRPADLAAAMSDYYEVAVEQVLPVRGSDDGIDLLLRAFCSAGKDSITISSPTFGMYKASAEVQGAEIVDVPLLEQDAVFSLDYDATVAASRNSKLLFICTPNNPTAHSVSRSDIESLCTDLKGDCMVIVDEAYIEFSNRRSASELLARHSNLVVLRTMSKAFGAAGIRCGAVLAHADIISVLHSISTPYALATPVVEIAVAGFQPAALAKLRERCNFLVNHCAQLAEAMTDHPLVEQVYPTDANFLLVRFRDCSAVFKALVEANVLVRDFSSAKGCKDCLRISVGLESENRAVLAVLDKLQSKLSNNNPVSSGSGKATG